MASPPFLSFLSVKILVHFSVFTSYVGFGATIVLIHFLHYTGTLFLWLFWPSFNGGLASGDAQYRAIINTYYAMVASVLAAFITSMFVDVRRKIDMVRYHLNLTGFVSYVYSKLGAYNCSGSMYLYAHVRMTCSTPIV